MATKVFISYAREDRRYLGKLLRFLSVLEKRGVLSVWYDSLLPAGERFAAEIDAQIDRVDIFIAMVSIDYLASPFCFEHEFARARAVSAQRNLTILPVLVSPCSWASTALGEYNALPFGSVFLSESPRVDRLLHGIALEIEKLAVGRLGARADDETGEQPAAPLRVPQLPSQYVRPTCALDSLTAGVESTYRQNLLDLDRRAVGLALCGLAGSGKTCLAIDLARTGYVRAMFSDGVVWLHCGRDSDPVGLQRRLLGSLGARRILSDRWQDNLDTISEEIDGKSLLLLLDDVWTADQASAFTAGAANGTLLFLTTRFENVARRANARTVNIEKPSADESLRILANYSRVPVEHLPPLSTEIVRLSGRLPLALAVIGSLLNNRVFGWNSLFRALESSRDRAVIMRFETQLTDYEWRSITAAFDASLDTLSQPASDALVMCRALGRSMTLPRSIFMTMTAHLHQGDLGAYLEIEEALVSRSLILRDTDADDTLLVFHDLIVDYCYERGREQENPHDVVLGNLLQPDGTDRSAVVDTLRERSAERYWQDELFRHAASSSRYRDVAVEALLDLDWMSGRADSFGADRLILDCSELDDDDHVRRLRDALRSCSHALGRSSEELLIQLDGRLPSELMEILLRRTAAPRGGTFRPRALRKNFTSSGDPTTRTLVFDGSPVRDLTVVADGTRLVARCAAGQIVVFDLPSCRVGYSVTPSSPVTPHAAVQRAPDGAKIYLGTGDSVLELDALEYRMSTLEPTSPMPGALLDVTRTCTGRKTFLGWTAESVYRVEVGSTGHDVALEAIASGRQVTGCELHEESGLFVLVETGGLISWGQTDALVLMTDRLDLGDEVRSSRLFDGGRRVLLSFFSGEVGVLDLTRGEFAWRLPVHRDWIEALTLDEGAGLVATGGQDQDVVVTGLADGTERLRVRGRSGYVKDVILASSKHADGPSMYLVWSTLDGALRLSQVDGSRRAIALGHSGRINRILSPRDGELVSCSDDGTIRLWSIPAIVRSYEETDEHVEKVSCIASADNLAWSAGYDGSLKVWDAGHGDLLASADLVDEPLHTLAPVNGTGCLVGTESGLVLAAELDRLSGQLVSSRVAELGGWISAMRLVTPRSLVVLGTGAGELALYDTRRGAVASVTGLHTGAVRSLEVDGSGRFLYSGGEDGRIVRFDLDTTSPAGEVIAHDDWVHKMLMHEQAGLLLSISDDATLRAFDPSSLEQRSPTLRHDGWVADIVLRPDGRAVFTMGQDGDVYTWDCTTFDLLSRTAAHSGWISCAGLAAGERALVTVAHDQMMKLWSSTETAPVATITIDTGANVNCLTVVDENVLVVGGENGKLFFLRLDGNP